MLTHAPRRYLRARCGAGATRVWALRKSTSALAARAPRAVDRVDAAVGFRRGARAPDVAPHAHEGTHLRSAPPSRETHLRLSNAHDTATCARSHKSSAPYAVPRESSTRVRRPRVCDMSDLALEFWEIWTKRAPCGSKSVDTAPVTAHSAPQTDARGWEVTRASCTGGSGTGALTVDGWQAV